MLSPEGAYQGALQELRTASSNQKDLHVSSQFQTGFLYETNVTDPGYFI